jgi:fructose-1,6-bisphosphatase
LLMLHRQVRDAVMESSRVKSGARNAKGDDVKLFDLAAADAALAALRKLQLPVVVDSEECARREFGSGTPRHRLVLDGAPLETAKSLTDRVSLIAASSRELRDEIVEVLGDGGH